MHSRQTRQGWLLVLRPGCAVAGRWYGSASPEWITVDSRAQVRIDNASPRQVTVDSREQKCTSGVSPRQITINSYE